MIHSQKSKAVLTFLCSSAQQEIYIQTEKPAVVAGDEVIDWGYIYTLEILTILLYWTLI